MKTLVSILLSFSLIGCSSNPKEPEHEYHPPPADAYVPLCTEGVACIAVWILVYGTIATVRYIQYGVKNLTRPTESIPKSIVLKCRIQTLNREFAHPCGPFMVEVLEKKSNKTRVYNLKGYDNQLNLVKGKNRVTVKVNTCGLTQQADDVKAGDVMQLEFPPECHKEFKAAVSQ